MGGRYVGEYRANFSTDLAALIARELQRTPHATPDGLANTMERHVERLREDPPEFPAPEERHV